MNSGESTRGAGIFQAGGTLREGALYVERAADKELPEALLRREFCYVLAPRQIGKSSLRVRTTLRLQREGVRTVTIDLTTIGSRNSTAAEWYFGLLHEVADQLGLPQPSAYWRDNDGLSPVHRFSGYLRKELLPRVQEQVVIFIDEIDSVLALAEVSRDDFFGSVRALFNQRAQDPAFERLTFCLIGVAMPSDLVEDEAVTPFNIGRSIALRDFTRDEMAAFLPSLTEHVQNPTGVLEEVFHWTDGHPYMAQTVCQHLCEESSAASIGQSATERVAAVVHRVFLDKGRVQDSNLSYAEKSFNADADRDGARLMRVMQREVRKDGTPSGSRAAFDSRESRTDARVLFKDTRTAAMLALYGRLRTGQRVDADGQDRVQMALRLTGMAKEQAEAGGTFLKVRNQIFADVFNSTWVRDLSAKRMLAAPLWQWLESGRRTEFLLRGEELKAAQEWARETRELTRTESEFLRAAEQAEDKARYQALITLFLTSLFKNFATYLLLLVMREWLVTNRAFTTAGAQSLFELFFAGTYVLPLIGGPTADLWLRHRRAVQVSLGMMALGYFVLTVGRRDVMYVALFLICAGNGLYKPGFTALVGTHYAPDDNRQDTAYLINYWCLNLGAMLAPLAVTFLFRGTNAAFTASGVAMIIGLLMFQRYPEASAPPVASSWDTPRPAEGIRAAARQAAWAAERVRLKSLVLVLGAVSLPFWMAFYQSGETANRWLELHSSPLEWLFDPTAKHHVSRAVNPTFVVVLAPILGLVMHLLRRKGYEPGPQAKMALGMLLTGVALMLLGTDMAQRGWVFMLIYCVLSLAELLLTPISYSLLVRLAPPRYLASALGVWFGVMIAANKLTEVLSSQWRQRGLAQHGYELVLAGLSFASCLAVLAVQLRGSSPRSVQPTR